MMGYSMTDPIHVLNLGAGVQSSTLALMATEGLVGPMPTAAIFADTMAEPDSVYKWLDWLEKRLAFPVYRVNFRDLSKDELEVRKSGKSGKIYKRSLIPAFTSSVRSRSCPDCAEDEENGVVNLFPAPPCDTCGGSGWVDKEHKGMLMRRCTGDYKIKPIVKKVRELAGVGRGEKEIKAIQWIGISTDEVIRMKPSAVPWSKHRWPLIEDLKMSRKDCLAWWAKKGMPAPPRSACVFCPYHNDHEWHRMKTEEPVEFAKAVAFERKMQDAMSRCEVSEGTTFLHSSLKPLDEIRFDPENRKGGFGNECEGMCGN